MSVAEVVAAADQVLVTALYPSGWGLTAAPLKDRVRHYKDAGLHTMVVHYSTEHEREPRATADPIAPVIVTHPSGLPAVLRQVRDADIPVLAHAPTSDALPHLHELAPRLGVWMHELLSVDYRRLATDCTTAELNAQRGPLDAANAALQQAFGPVFADAGVPVVFASEHQRRHAEYDVAAPASNGRVIPHHVAPVPHLARVRTPEEARSILLMTTSNAHHAGGDIAVRALEILSRRRGFNDLGISILGGGPAVARSPLATMRNVHVSTPQPGPAERAAASFDHGVLLSPSRWNTHDPVLANAMSHGMVAITHPVGGTPEYVDESCAVLPRAGDPWAFADALWELVEHPERVPQLSSNAIGRVTTQCGWQETIRRDLDIIKELAR